MTALARLLTLALSLFLAPLASEAQRPRTIPRIAFLTLADAPLAVRSEGFVHGLRELGYVEGQHLILEYWGSAGNLEQLRANAAELVQRGVHVIVTGGPSRPAPPSRPRARSPLSWRETRIPWGMGSWPVWGGRAATSQA